MADLLISLAKDVPAIVALIAVVLIFVRHQRHADESRNQVLHELGHNWHSAQDRSNHVLGTAAQAIGELRVEAGELRKTTAQVAPLLVEVRGAIEKANRRAEERRRQEAASR